MCAVSARPGCAPCIKYEEPYARMKIGPHSETLGNRLFHFRRKKTLERTPRESHCLDRAQTSTTQCSDGLPLSTSLLRVLFQIAHTRSFDRKHTKNSQIYIRIHNSYLVCFKYAFCCHFYHLSVISLFQGAVFRIVPVFHKIFPQNNPHCISASISIVSNFHPSSCFPFYSFF